ncbi:class I SAM-dependent methyltransferase [Amaricoccus solimangrovi]|uniref:Class I SAM-dependent methyltransferase n=1 Tax=Amaricoccus solimangrovi TaxID=2589815 RepID=A0A501WM85_9RHOB|nr:class I SAM-dependent methyltransferase [Amaricoccus solimangrovi]TPE46856.1 class I SAM-dependent methyltransferase [Amaricoccus solimangrovi]
MREVIDAAGFERKYRENIDPWDYATSPFEVFKRRALLRACGSGPFGRALELACGTGVTSRALAPRCLRLVATDASPTAIAEARRHAGPWPGLRHRHGLLPRDFPPGPFDLIVASEILYYLGRRDLALLVARMDRALAPGGRIVLLHHVVDFDDAATRPRDAQRLAVMALRRRMRVVFRLDTGRFEVVSLVARSCPNWRRERFLNVEKALRPRRSFLEEATLCHRFQMSL